MHKPRIYVDMDGVLCDYITSMYRTLAKTPQNGFPQASYGFFRDMGEMDGAVEAYLWLHENFDTWILTRPSVLNPMCYTEKREWVEKHLGIDVCEKLIMCTEKGLLKGDYLIDDMPWPSFEGQQIRFGSTEFPDWKTVIATFKAILERHNGGVAQMVEQRRRESPRVGDSSAPSSADDFEEEWNRCKNDPKYFMEKYAHVKTDRLQKPEPGSVNVEKLVDQYRNDPQEHDTKVVEVNGKKYTVAWEYTYMGDLCYYDFEIPEGGFLTEQFFLMDMHAYNPSVNYAWKVMHVHGELDLPDDLRRKIDVFLDELAQWDNSIDPSEALYDLRKFCRIRNENKEDIRHYLRDLLVMLDHKTDVILVDHDISGMRKKVCDLLLEIDAAIMWDVKRSKSTVGKE